MSILNRDIRRRKGQIALLDSMLSSQPGAYSILPEPPAKEELKNSEAGNGDAEEKKHSEVWEVIEEG